MFEELRKHYQNVIRVSEYYNIIKPCNETSLLFPPFYEKIKELISAYLEDHETMPYILETYRSNDLQKIYYNRGASKIRKNGMHHFGIAVDLVAKDENDHIRYDVLDYQWIRKKAREMSLFMLDWEDAHIQDIPVGLQNQLRNEVL